MSTPRTIVESVGVYNPGRTLSNVDLIKILAASGVSQVPSRDGLVDLTPELIERRTGVKQRRIALPDETSVSMAVEAAKDAINRADIEGFADGNPIDYIIFATNATPRKVPSSASLVQGALLNHYGPKIISPNAAGEDIMGGCGGINLAHMHADALVRMGQYRRVLVIGAEKLSGVTDYSDPKTTLLFSDGASAEICTAVYGDHGFVGHYTKGNPAGSDKIFVTHGPMVVIDDAMKFLVDGTVPTKKEGRILGLDGRNVLTYFHDSTLELIGGFETLSGLNPEGLSIDEIAAFVAHQSNARMFKMIGDKHQHFGERCIVTISDYGNTSVASQGLPFRIALQRGKPGDHILRFGFGAGYTEGANLYRIPNTKLPAFSESI